MELKIGERGEKILQLLMLGILMLSMFVISKEGALFIHTSSTQVVTAKKKVIVIDAGHGGIDPGKIGIHGEQEKEINLKIAEILKTFLELDGYEVVMTRTEDGGLYDENTSNKKVQDMKRRIEVIEEADPILVVSIHQNSYPDPAIKGAQVFYHKSSEKGKRLAGILQQSIKEKADKENHRVEKANASYYMLRKVSCPIVIVECGFLSNPDEERLLNDEKYQKKMVEGIAEGIENFLYK